MTSATAARATYSCSASTRAPAAAPRWRIPAPCYTASTTFAKFDARSSF
uniref:Uncharacterized protein n=1 Tax=Arundo donax TaxID=35708 RepID=A0A0A9BC94_ARUDO